MGGLVSQARLAEERGPRPHKQLQGPWKVCQQGALWPCSLGQAPNPERGWLLGAGLAVGLAGSGVALGG